MKTERTQSMASNRGIAVLRVDDRGVGGSTGSTSKSTSADFAQEFDRVKDKIDIFAEALTEPRSVETMEPTTVKADEPLRRVAVK